MSELRACPFCGTIPVMADIEPHIHMYATFMPDHSGRTYVECPGCGVGIIRDTEAEAVAAWNRRSGWVSVGTRLPEDDERVIVFCNDGVMRHMEYRETYQYFAGCGLSHIGDEPSDKFKVTHWMKLPEPPAPPEDAHD